jgi:DNA primase
VEELQGVVSKVRVIRIPAGKDPDEYIRTDPDGWRAAVASAEELLPYFMERAASEVDLRQAQGRSGYTRRMLDLLRRIPDRVEQDSYIPQLSRLAGIDERILRDEMTHGPAPIPVRPASNGVATESESQLSPLEREALTLLLLNPSLTADLPEGEWVPIRDEAGRELAHAWRAVVVTGSTRPDLEAWVGGLDAATADLARSLLASARARGLRPNAEADREALRVCLLRLRVGETEARLSDLQALIRATADEDDTTDIRSLEQQFQELTRAREQLMRAIREPAVGAGDRRS